MSMWAALQMSPPLFAPRGREPWDCRRPSAHPAAIRYGLLAAPRGSLQWCVASLPWYARAVRLGTRQREYFGVLTYPREESRMSLARVFVPQEALESWV